MKPISIWVDQNIHYSPGERFTPPKTIKKTLNGVTGVIKFLNSQISRGRGWVVEPKYEGVRCIIHKKGSDIRLDGGQDKDLTKRFSTIVSQIQDIPKDLILDSVLVLHNNQWNAMVFDAVYYGKDLNVALWSERHRIINNLCMGQNIKKMPNLVVESMTELLKACKFVSSISNSKGAIIKKYSEGYFIDGTSTWININL